MWATKVSSEGKLNRSQKKLKENLNKICPHKEKIWAKFSKYHQSNNMKYTNILQNRTLNGNYLV